MIKLIKKINFLLMKFFAISIQNCDSIADKKFSFFISNTIYPKFAYLAKIGAENPSNLSKFLIKTVYKQLLTYFTLKICL